VVITAPPFISSCADAPCTRNAPLTETPPLMDKGQFTVRLPVASTALDVTRYKPPHDGGAIVTGALMLPFAVREPVPENRTPELPVPLAMTPLRPWKSPLMVKP